MIRGKIFEIKRFAVHDGDGIRTTVFFKGCPLSCVWCHNPEGISYKSELAYYESKCVGCGECVKGCSVGAQKMVDGKHVFDRSLCVSCGICVDVCFSEALKLYGREIGVEELLVDLLADKDFYDTSGGGVTLSGGECLKQADFCAELLKRLKENGVNTAVDTCGYVGRDALDKVIPYTDVFLFDVKAIDEDVHIACTGRSNTLILENLRYLDSLGKKIEIRFPFVPEKNSAQAQKIADFLSDLQNIVRVRVLPYHNFAGSKYESLNMENTLPDKLPTEKELEEARKYFE